MAHIGSRSHLDDILKKIAGKLRAKDIKKLKFLCYDVIPVCEIEKSDGLGILEALVNHNAITWDKPMFLVKCLKKIYRNDLAEILNPGSNETEDFCSTKLNRFRSLLFDVAIELRDTNVRFLKFSYRDKIPKSDEVLDGLDLFTALMEARVISESSFQSLVTYLSPMRKDLAKKLEEYSRCPVEDNRAPIPEIGSNREYSRCPVEENRPPIPEIGSNREHSQSPVEENRPPIQEIGSNPENTDEYYKMDADPRGYCIIINNINFINRPDLYRKGADIDQNNLEPLFVNLKFEVKLHNNLTSQEMTHCLTEYSKEDHSGYDCFVCFILSHGYKEHVQGTDETCVKIKDLIELMYTDKCPSLLDKPKLFFIQACQNELEQHSFTDVVKIPKCPLIKADIFLFISTVTDHVAFRSADNGSRFIKHLVDVFNKHAAEKNLQEMITKIMYAVSKDDYGGVEPQLPTYEGQLRKTIRFL